ncbi:MAG: LPS export ABC transporter ATP-binding protein [Planctomycetota bacterium]
MPLLEVDNLAKSYRRRKVVNGISFGIDEGEIVGLLGRNGAGKTTTFRMIIGMITPDAGEVRFQGRDISRLPMYRRARLGLGYLSQEPSIFQGLTVADNLMAILETLPMSRPRRRAKLAELLEVFGLTPLAKSRAVTLSGGERRRLEITRALVLSPALILLDEPFAGIDPIAVADIQANVRALRDRGISVLLTDHNVRETLTITDRSTIIDEGRKIAEGPPEVIVSDPVVRKSYLGEGFKL